MITKEHDMTCTCGHARIQHGSISERAGCLARVPLTGINRSQICGCEAFTERAPSPSGDAVDRATKLIMETQHNALVTEVAQLIERADAAAPSSGLILNEDIQAEDCRNCGASWQRCLQGGWGDDSDNGPHPMDVCCPECHETDTHQAGAARRREQARRNEDTQRAQIPEGLRREIELLMARPEQIDGHTVHHWHKTAEQRKAHIEDLQKVISERNRKIAALEGQAANRQLRVNELEHDAIVTRETYEQHARTRQGRLLELEAELRTARREANEARASAAVRALEIATVDQLLEALRKRTL